MTQYILAGLGEVAKFHNVLRRLNEIRNSIPPYGDQPRDFAYNTRGMLAAEEEIKKNGRPEKPIHAKPIRRSGGYYHYY